VTVSAVSGATLQAHVIGFKIDRLKAIERQVGRTIDGLGNRTVDEWLQGGLHAQMLFRCQFCRRREVFRAFRHLAVQGGVGSAGVVHRMLEADRAVAFQNAAVVFGRKDGLNATRDVAGEQRNGAGWCNRRQAAVADAMLRDGPANACIEALEVWAGEKVVAVEQWERAFLGG
jgi:hypothetical protein